MAYSKPTTVSEIVTDYGDLLGEDLQKTVNDALSNGDSTLSTIPVLQRNEFILTLVNKTFEQRLYNPLNFRQPYEIFIEDGNMAYGSTIENLATDIPEIEDYSEESTLCKKKKKPKVVATYINTTDRKKMEISYAESIMDAVFTTEGGAYQLIQNLLSKVKSAENKYIYDKITTDLSKIDITYNLPTIKSGDPDSAKAFMEKLTAFMGDLEYPETKYNKAGLTENLTPERAVLVIDNNTYAKISTEFYTVFYNSDKQKLSDLFAHVIKIKSDTPVMYILDSKAYLAKFRVKFTDVFRDPSNMVTTFYYHFWVNRGLTGTVPTIKINFTDEA